MTSISKDRYCRYRFDPATGTEEKEWICYEDGVFEPVRQTGKLSAKWNDQRTHFKWWKILKPVDWHPSDEGYDFSWNHTLGEENKPVEWGDKSSHEASAGDTPFYMALELNDDHRISLRTERLNGRRETWRFSYEESGHLTGCQSDTGWSQEFEYDDNGFRVAHRRDGKETRYTYSPDYRLLGVRIPDGRKLRYDHDHGGMRRTKLVDDVVVEQYEWLDFLRLSAFSTQKNKWRFHYEEFSRLPHRATVNGVDYTLHYDQVGSLKAVVSDTGNVVKTIQYGPFGDVLHNSNPALRVPIGFAGGLSDPDTGFVRFGWRDYDPNTGRWTAPDPIGDAGGDPDWFGYCYDDPVNIIDPLGLNGWGFGGGGHDFPGGGSSSNSSNNDKDNDSGQGHGNGGWGFGSGGHDFPGGLGPSTGAPDGNDSDSAKSWVDRLKHWVQQFDYRTEKGKKAPAGRSLYQQVKDRRTAEKAKAEIEAQAKAEQDRVDKERQQDLYTEREKQKDRRQAEMVDYMEEKEKEVLGSPHEPLGGVSEPLGGTQRTTDIAQGKNVPSPNETKAKSREVDRATLSDPYSAESITKNNVKSFGNKFASSYDPFAEKKEQKPGEWAYSTGLPDLEFDVPDIAPNKQKENASVSTAVNPGKKTLEDVRSLKAKEKGLAKNVYTGPRDYDFNYMAKARERMWAGIAKGIWGGTKGTKTAFGKLGNAFATNRDFRNWTLGTIGLGFAPVVGALSLPSTAAVAIPSASTAYGVTKAVENVADAIDNGPPSTPLGYAIKTIDSIINQ